MIKLLPPKFLSFFTLILFAIQFTNAQQEVIHCWDFNGGGSNFNNTTVPEIHRVTGTGSITHTFESVSSFAGNSSNACDNSNAGQAFSPTGSSSLGNNGKYLELEFSSEGFEGLVLSFWTNRSATGFSNNKIQYSVDNGAFIDLPNGTYNPRSATDGRVEFFDISVEAPVTSNNSTLKIRIILDGATNSSGNNRIDNLKLEGVPIDNNDDDSVVINPEIQIPEKPIVAADVTTLLQPEPIFSFDIQDSGISDGLSTDVTRMQFVQGPENTVNWSTAINALVLRDNGGNEVQGDFSIFGSEIIFEPTSPLSIADGTSENFTVEVVLNDTGIIDGSVIQLSVSEVDANFEADSSGSQFTNVFPAEVLGNPITIDVVATELRFLQQPSNANVNNTMTPPVEVAFTDVNGNLDVDVASSIILGSTGALNDASVSVTAIDGVATFSGLVHSAAGTELELTASGENFTAISDFFNIIDNDATSEVVAPEPSNQTPAKIITAVDAVSTQEEVFVFDIADQGGDGLPTEVSQLRFVPGSGNTANWSATLQQVIVNESGTEIPGTYSISDTEIIFTPDAPVVVDEGLTERFTVDILLNATEIIDESVIQFQVDGTDSGFEALNTGSVFTSTFTNGDVTGNAITIDVVATAIAFLQQPTDVEVNAFIAPAVQVAYVDVNGNVDVSIMTEISLNTNGGSLANAINPVTPVNGVATFPNIGYAAEAAGVSLTAETSEPVITPSTLESASFNVGIPVIAIQDFDGTQPEWAYSTSIPPFTDTWGTSYFDIINSTNAGPLSSGSFSENIFGVNNLNDTATLDFVTVDVSGYTDVNLSFDWEVFGNENSIETLAYEVFLDGTGQGNVTVFTGDATLLNESGAVSVSIPNGTQEVSLVVTVQDNGQDSYIGLDNFKLTGNSNARDTDIVAPGTQSPADTFIADVNDELAEAVEVFSFDVVDSGNFDNLPTNITRLRFVPGTNNTANWEDVIQGVSITHGTTTLDQANQALTITSTEIILDINADPTSIFEVADGSSKTYTISLFLNDTGITDGEVIQFAIDEGNDDQIASSDGSLFSSTIDAFEGNEFLIDVVGRGLEFSVQPSTTAINVNMNPSVRVINPDANGNFDTDGVINITSTGTLTQSPIPSDFGQNGSANFNTIRHTQPGFDLILTAELVSNISLPSIESDPFDITQNPTLLISEVVDPSDNPDGRYVELFNTDVEPLNLDDQSYFLQNLDGTTTSIQLTGSIPAKSYYVISFVDEATFNVIYSRNPDFEAPTGLASDGNQSYQLTFDENEPRAVMDVYGDTGETGWQFEDSRAIRKIPTVRAANPVYIASEWDLEPASTSDATIGIGDNDFVYNGNWTSEGIGDSPENVSGGSNADKSMFIESGTVTLSAANEISDVVVRDGATLIIEDLITLDGDFANFGKVTFRSTETKTAVLGEFNSNRRLVGDNYEVERFIPRSNRAFRYISSPVRTLNSPKPSIRANWQEGQNNSQTGDSNNSNTNPGYGTHITGSKTGANGLDATQSGNPSLFRWNTSRVDWDPVLNTSTTQLEDGQAFALMIRGDRSTTLNSNDAKGPATTLRTTGRLRTGSRGPLNVSTTIDGFSLIGNPYQAKYDLQAFLGSTSAQGISSQYIYIYDPTLGERGGYATVDLTDGTSTTPETIPEGSDANAILEPNQAFFVQTTSTSPAVSFQESFKYTSGGTGNNATFSVPEQLTNMKINLFYANVDSKPVDALKVKFRTDGNNAKDSLDATKFWNYQEAFAIDRNPDYISIESRAMPTAQDSIPFYFSNFTRSEYRMEFTPENLTGAKAYLYDKYTDVTVELPTDVITKYNLTIDESIPASKATDRFVVKFEEVTLSNDEFENSSLAVYPNPVRGERFLISHQGAFQGSTVQLQLFDLQGRMVMNQAIDNAPSVEVNLDSSLSAGVYILKLSDADASQSVKLIIE